WRGAGRVRRPGRRDPVSPRRRGVSCRAGAEELAVPLDSQRGRPPARRDLAGRRAAAGPRGDRSRLCTESRADRRLATGAVVIPVAVLTGFLGSGKTTLLGHLLRR